MNSAVAKVTTVPITEARYVIAINGEAKECFGSFEEAAFAYGCWLDQFQPHARTNVVLLRVEVAHPAGTEIGFY